MDNDLIRQQIESAKKSFVSTKTKQNEQQHDAQMSMANAKQSGTVTNLSRIEQQAHIMGRLKSLMDEAATTPRQERFSHKQEDGRGQQRDSAPFWAQKHNDIPPSERFATQQREQESRMAETPPSDPIQTAAPSDEQRQISQPTPAQTAVASVSPKPAAAEPVAMPVKAPSIAPSGQPKPSHEDALSAIRSEVFSHMEKAPIPAELLERIEQIEHRANQQQQDLTAVLKLVRQLTAAQKELEAGRQQKHSGFLSRMLLSLLAIIGIVCVGAVGWLYIMNPSWMYSIFTQVINTIFSQTIYLLSMISGLIGLEM